MQNTFTAQERADLLAMAKVLDTIEPEASEPEASTTDTTEEVTITAPVPVVTDDHTAALDGIIAKSKGVRSTGETLVAQYIDALWSKRKLSKVQAAAQGLVASEHNKAAWADVQALRQRMLTAVRKASRDASYVAPKLASKREAKRDPNVDALLLKHADNPAVQALAELLGL